MTKTASNIGIAGFDGIGSNLAMTFASKGYSVAAYYANDMAPAALRLETHGGAIEPAASVSEFIRILSVPRTIIIPAPSGLPVDRLIKELEPVLTSGDVIIDAGNTYFKDTEARATSLGARGIDLLGVGISGGERGARHGASIMAGGSRSAYDRVFHILSSIAARVNGEPCVAYLGPRSAGHYVSMIHNGVVQGLTQLIAETFDLMSRGLGISNAAIQQVYAQWQASEVGSDLLGILAQKLRDNKANIGADLFDLIVDEPDRDESARWASLEARALQQSIPTIDVSVAIRALSTVEEGLAVLRRMMGRRQPIQYVDKPEVLNQQLKRALCVGMIATLAQGLAFLKAASEVHRFDLSIRTVARVWRGSILRSPMLQEICDVLYVQPHLLNLLLDPRFAHQTRSRRRDLLAMVRLSMELGVPAPALAASLTYYDAQRRVEASDLNKRGPDREVHLQSRGAQQANHEIRRLSRSVT